MVSLVYSTCLKLVVMTVLLMITCGQVSPSSPFVVLGSTSNTRACVGVQISPLHVLLLSKCVDRNDALTKASTLVIPTNSSSSTTGLTKEEAILQSHVAIIDATSLQLETPSKDSLHAVTLAKPLSSSAVILPLQSEIPELDSNATLVSLDLTAMEVSWAREVVYVDGSLCKHSACVLPVDVEAREMLSEPNKWSFLVRQAKNEDQVSLLGLGGHLVTNEDGIWGFSWLPKLLTSSTFLDNGIQGVHTVQTVKKEIVGGRVIEKMDKYTEFIVGLRISEKATSKCTGSLIAPRSSSRRLGVGGRCISSSGLFSTLSPHQASRQKSSPSSSSRDTTRSALASSVTTSCSSSSRMLRVVGQLHTFRKTTPLKCPQRSQRSTMVPTGSSLSATGRQSCATRSSKCTTTRIVQRTCSVDWTK